MKYETQEYWGSLIRMSMSRLFILETLCDKRLHGYEITRQVSNLTKGCCAPSEGSLYPVLKEFEREGLVVCTAEIVRGRERKVYSLTEKGYRAHSIGLTAWTEVAGYINQMAAKNNFKQEGVKDDNDSST